MTFLVERLSQLRLHLKHLRDLAPRVRDAESLRADLSLHNDVLFSLLVVCQAVLGIAGELAGRRGIRFEDYRSSCASWRAWRDRAELRRRDSTLSVWSVDESPCANDI